MWPSSARQISYGLPSETGMVGLRDVFVVAPASSFHHHEPIISDPHGINASNNAAAAAATALGVGVIPLLTATPCLVPPANIGVDEDGLNTNRSRGSGIQLWQNQQSQHSNFLQSSGGGIGGSAVVATCQDCGNQAKKGCNHERCRTCCKSRGFDCSTHVKSTWIPAVRRRERQLKGSTTTTAAAAAGSSGSTSGAKKPRLITSQTTTTTSASNTPPRSFDTSSSHQDASFKEGLPGQVRVPAVFKCVRVTAVDDDDDEYAYQAVVKIGGHVFKGFLYDHGVEEKDGFPNISELHLGGGGGGGGGGGRNGASLSSPILDTSAVYGGSGGGLLGVSSYGNQMIN